MSTAPIAFLDLAAQHAEVEAEVDLVWKEVCGRTAFIGGATVARFEEAWAAFCGTRHAIGVANGTDALHLVLRGLGIGPGDEVVVPANTFVATAEAVALAGARPVFVDVDPATLLVTADHVDAAVGPRTAAVVAVHLYGQTPDMDALSEACRRHGLALVEDAAQAQGAAWNGRRAGSWGVAAASSFYPGKNLGAYGDAGAVTTDDDDLARRIRSIANHGTPPGGKYEHDLLGTNSRLDALQAGVLAAKLARLEAWNDARRRVHALYGSVLPASARQVATAAGTTPVHHLEVVQVDDRPGVQAALSAAGIGHGVHYPVPCHHLPPFRTGDAPVLPVVEAAAHRILSLPMHPHLRDHEVARVAEVIAAHGRPVR